LPDELQKYGPKYLTANSMIERVIKATSSGADTTKVAHLITKIVEEKKEREQVNIVFSYTTLHSLI
jgi:hypothetical protein